MDCLALMTGSSPASTPAGMFHATLAIKAMSVMVLCRSGAPFTKNLPSS